MRFAPEGRWFIVGAWVGVAALAAAGVRAGAAVAAVLAVWVMWFFRDPERDWALGEDLILAPADGKVVSVGEVDEPSFLGGMAVRISIFMNVFDCHVNRYPVGGTVEYRFYNPGKFLNAAGDKASLDNEQASLGLRGPRGPVLVRQIAGLVARRIVTDARPSARCEQGARLGMIRFGSRVDVFLPVEQRATPRVAEGDRVRAGVTILAEYP